MRRILLALAMATASVPALAQAPQAPPAPPASTTPAVPVAPVAPRPPSAKAAFRACMRQRLDPLRVQFDAQIRAASPASNEVRRKIWDDFRNAHRHQFWAARAVCRGARPAG